MAKKVDLSQKPKKIGKLFKYYDSRIKPLKEKVVSADPVEQSKAHKKLEEEWADLGASIKGIEEKRKKLLRKWWIPVVTTLVAFAAPIVVFAVVAPGALLVPGLFLAITAGVTALSVIGLGLIPLLVAARRKRIMKKLTRLQESLEEEKVDQNVEERQRQLANKTEENTEQKTETTTKKWKKESLVEAMSQRWLSEFKVEPNEDYDSRTESGKYVFKATMKIYNQDKKGPQTIKLINIRKSNLEDYIDALKKIDLDNNKAQTARQMAESLNNDDLKVTMTAQMTDLSNPSKVFKSGNYKDANVYFNMLSTTIENTTKRAESKLEATKLEESRQTEEVEEKENQIELANEAL